MEFVNMLSPLNKQYAMNLKTNKSYESNYDNENEITHDTKELFINVLDNLLSNEIKVEKLRNSVNKASFFSVKDAFESLKNSLRNFLIKDDFKLFLSICNSFASETEIDLLFERFDKNHDGKVTFNEVVNY